MVTIRAFLQRGVAVLDLAIERGGLRVEVPLGACAMAGEDLTTYTVRVQPTGIKVLKNGEVVEDEALAQNLAQRVVFAALERL